jgi:hypothetical protein
MARAELLGWGAQITYPNLTEASLSWALDEVLNNPKYKENTLEITNRLKDQPQTPMDRAVFWVEYVLRHNGAHYMQTSAQYLNFFEYHNLDIYATFALIAFVAIFIPIYITRKVLKIICSFMKGSFKSKDKKKKN